MLYFFFGTISWYVIGGTFSYHEGKAIKDGDINKFLLRPINFTFNFFLREQAWKVTALVLALPFTIFFLILFWHDIHLQWSFIKIITLLFSVLAGATIFALLQAIIGLSAFWVTDIWSVIEADDILMILFGGRIAPLVLMPSLVQNIADFLPYKYVFYTPLMIFLDKTSSGFLDIQKQIICIVVLIPIYVLIWKAGLRRYEGIGI